MQRLREFPPFPKVSSRENLEGSITTRILAERLNRQRENQSTSRSDSLKSQSLRSQPSSVDRKRNSLRAPVKFLRGAALPNSVARSVTGSTTNKDDKTMRKVERGTYVAEVIRRLQIKLHPPTEATSLELQDSEDAATSTLEEKISELSLPVESVSIVSKDQASIKEADPEKERMRIIRRTSILSPLPHKKLPTRESIKNAISNSKTATKVIDVNSMERKKRSTSSDTLGAFSLAETSWATLRNRVSKASKRMASKYLRQKSILKRKSKETVEPATSISENRKEHSQTQTVLRMKDLKDLRQKFIVDN